MHKSKTIPTELCQMLPFLRQLPPDLLLILDTATLYLPSGVIAQMREELEEQLNCHIATYRSVPPVLTGHERLHLCRLLVPASLTPVQMEQLKRAEAACHDAGVVLVAYKKPLQLWGHKCSCLINRLQENYEYATDTH